MVRIVLMMGFLGVFCGATFASEDEGEKPSEKAKVEKAAPPAPPVGDISTALTPSQQNDLTQMRIICEKSIAVGLVKREEDPTPPEAKGATKQAGKKKASDGRAKDALEILKSLLNEDVTKEGGNKGKTKGDVMEAKLRKLIEGKTPAEISQNFTSTLALVPAAPPAAEGEEAAAKVEAPAPSPESVPAFKASYHGKWKKDAKDKAAGENQDFAGKMALYARCISMATAKRACAKTQNEPCGTTMGRVGAAMGFGPKVPKNKEEAKTEAAGMLSDLVKKKKKKKDK